MARFKIDGDRLKLGSKVIANVHGDRVREGTGSRTLCNIHGDRVREGTGSKVLFNLHGDELRLGTSSSKIATMADVHAAIDGPGGITKAAMWFWFIR